MRKTDYARGTGLETLRDLAVALEQRAPGVITEPLLDLILAIDDLDPAGDAVRYPTDRDFNEWSVGVDVMNGGHNRVIRLVDAGRDVVEDLRTLPERTEVALRTE